MRRLVIVDDEKDMLDFLERVFRREYEVVRCQSVEEAEGALFGPDGAPAEVVITDRRMPRRSGLELLQIVADRSPGTLRVLLTGYADSLVDEKADKWALVDAWVSKPIDSAELRGTIVEALAEIRERGR
jgi:DNA-binding NtrC family response regulator